MKLLFVTYGGGHVAMTLPVAKRAVEEGYSVTVLALTTAYKTADASGVPTIGYANLWPLAETGARQYGLHLCPDVSDSDPVPPEESIAYHGINFAELVIDRGAEGAEAEFKLRGRHAFLPVRFMERVLHDQQPNVVIATNSPRSEQAVILAARNLSIPSICLVDLFALQEVQWIGQPGYADRVCVLNDAVRSFLLNHGRQPDEVIVTGNPAFESLGTREACASGAALRKARGWDDGRINILWASQVEPEQHPFDSRAGDTELPRIIERCLRGIVSEDDSLRLIVRYHPSEIIAFVDSSRVSLSANSEPLSSLLHAVDLVVVTASTVGLEAHLAGKPLISVDLSIFTPDAPYSKMGISKGVRSMDELVLSVKNWAGEFTRSGLSAPPAAPPPVSATENILRVIQDLAHERRSKQ